MTPDRPTVRERGVPISDATLDALIERLELYRKQGASDPWLLSAGTVVEPLELLWELRAYRKQTAPRPASAGG